MDVEPDGLQFDPVSIRVANIREGQAHEGRRVRILTNLGNARITVQVDIGFGDAVVPGAKEITYPVLLDFPAPRILAYPPESIVAEKLEALVSLGMANTRMKDFYDLRLIARSFLFEGPKLVKSIQATFNRRKTDIPANIPTALNDEFAGDKNKQRQWAAFLDRSGLNMKASILPEVIQELRLFLVLPLKAAATNTRFTKSWGAGETWG